MSDSTEMSEFVPPPSSFLQRSTVTHHHQCEKRKERRGEERGAAAADSFLVSLPPHNDRRRGGGRGDTSEKNRRWSGDQKPLVCSPPFSLPFLAAIRFGRAFILVILFSGRSRSSITRLCHPNNNKPCLIKVQVAFLKRRGNDRQKQ